MTMLDQNLKIRSVSVLNHCRYLAMATILLGIAPSGSVYAQQAAGEEAIDSEGEKKEENRPVIELGRFQIKDLRPTRNETAKVSFVLHLALKPTVDKRTVEQLEFWKHRIRNQVITAVRIAETRDFLEPGLNRFRRSITLRVNRALKAALVSEILFTEFTFTTN